MGALFPTSECELIDYNLIAPGGLFLKIIIEFPNSVGAAVVILHPLHARYTSSLVNIWESHVVSLVPVSDRSISTEFLK